MSRKRLGYIELNRKLVSIDECPYCRGIFFNFEVEQLDLNSMVSQELIRKIRKRVGEGASLDQLLEEFEELIVDEYEYGVCEKCRHEISSPKHHVGA
jgi:Zn-finger nucleic acid-binding protein